MSDRKKLVRTLVIVAILAAIAIIIAALLFLLTNPGVNREEVKTVPEEEGFPTAVYVTEETEQGCPRFAFDYPEGWEVESTGKGLGSLAIQIPDVEDARIELIAGHSGGVLGEYIGDRVSITEVSPAELSSGPFKHAPAFDCIVADEFISGIQNDYVHSSGYGNDYGKNGMEMLALVPSSWVGEWSTQNNMGTYEFIGSAGCPYIFKFGEPGVDYESGDHKIEGIFALGFYCTNADQISDEDREKVIATIASLRVA